MMQSLDDLTRNVLTYTNMEESIKSHAKDVSHHIKFNMDYWGFTLWNESEVNLDCRGNRNINYDILHELANDFINNKHTTPRPNKFECLNNVILTQGIQESIDRDIAVSSTDLDYMSIGTSATAELESQTDLQSEFTDTAYARKQLSVAAGGSRTRSSQTMRLGMLWQDDSFDSVPVTIREAGIHWHLSDASKCHARVVSTDFVMNAGNLFHAQINELQENGTL